MKGAVVHVYGQQPRIMDNPQVSYNQAVHLGADPAKITQLIVASDDSKPGHKGVYPPRYGDILHADGTVLSEAGSAAVIQAADCPVIVMIDGASGRIAFAHAGRPALSPTAHCASCTVTENMLHALFGRERDCRQLEVLVTGNICGPCFKHDRAEARPLIEPFLRYPDAVFADRTLGALDLFALIKHQLIFAGVPEVQIRHAGPCSLETPLLSSHRRGDNTRNTFIVVKNE
jgi:copper oxidase (laccase) domain-containing protein